ncbi:amidohydrolase family protein [Hamadaea sp. NPDC051192]|uniref:amidohydrolase family protein n=1 Tax=Hamadaea sp. NPDC051192 TaxID=3154940 RepID=UPI0034399FCE
MLALRAARLFDGEHAALLEQPVVLVEQGRVVAAASGLEPPVDAEVVDLGDVTLLPGLVDGHIHLTFDAGADPVGRFDRVDDADLLAGARVAAERALQAGVTTVRDLGDRNYVTLGLRDDPTLPRILSAGPPITSMKGHCWFLGGEALGVDGVRRAVRERAERGVDVVKVMATGGELTAGTQPHLAQFGLAAMRAAVEEAHRAGLPITAHAHGAPGIFNAASAGFDSVEHCSFTTETGASADAGVIQALLANGVTVSATLGHLPGFTLPPRIAALIPQLSGVFHQIREAGVPVVCSSDAGIGPAKPHDCLPYGAGEMVNLLGYTPVEALRSMTSRAADLCRVGDRVGRIQPGHDADLLAVAGNPLADVAALHDVVGVWRLGTRVR